jgi:branched-chain amino acid transport system substrate-binding protein
VMWAEQVNAAGGLDVRGRKRPVELIGMDDHSDLDTCTRSYLKLMGGDKVDLILPPWGTSANFALAPIANRYGYPLVAPTALSRKLVDMGLPYFFSMLQQPDKMMGALLDMLVAKGARTLVIMYMDDLFGLENFSALNQALKKTSLQVLDRKTYPLGVKDLAPILGGFKALNPDAFVGITYPPDTLLASRQSHDEGFNPKFFYTSVGTAFQLYKTVLQAAAEGVLGMGSWNAKTSPQAKAYFDAHVKRFNKEPDRWASGHCWAGLQMLEQAVAKVGLDRKALREQIATNEFTTILGPVRFDGSENASVPGTVGQWQGSEFEVVWPPERATAAPIVPKPTWK